MTAHADRPQETRSRAEVHCDDAATGSTAVSSTTRRPCGLVVTDIIMHGLSGIEIATVLRRHRSWLPVICMSGSWTASQGMELPPDMTILHKPCAVGDFISVVRETRTRAMHTRLAARDAASSRPRLSHATWLATPSGSSSVSRIRWGSPRSGWTAGSTTLRRLEGARSLGLHQHPRALLYGGREGNHQQGDPLPAPARSAGEVVPGAPVDEHAA